jgi:hypothetical protein
MGVINDGGRMIYTPEVSAAIRSIPMPVELNVDVVDYGAYLGIRFYESEWTHLSESERLKMAIYFQAVRKMLERGGVQSTLDPVYDKPGVQQLG